MKKPKNGDRFLGWLKSWIVISKNGAKIVKTKTKYGDLSVSEYNEKTGMKTIKTYHLTNHRNKCAHEFFDFKGSEWCKKCGSPNWAQKDAEHE